MSPKSVVLKTTAGAGAAEEISSFLGKVGSRYGWTGIQTDRLILVGDEMAATLMVADDDGEARRIVVKARSEGSSIELEFVTSGSDGNIEDEIMLLGEQPVSTIVERELSLRLLRHYASSVHHQSFTDADILTARVERPEQGTSKSRPSIE